MQKEARSRYHVDKVYRLNRSVKNKKYYQYRKHSYQNNVHISKINALLNLISKSSNKSKMLYLAFATFYFINPFDVIPDLAPVVGFLDDLLVCTTALECIKQMIPFGEFKKQIKTKLSQFKKGGTKHGKL